MAEKEGFEPSIPFWGIHDFQSCALGQLRDFSKNIALCNQLAYITPFVFVCQDLIRKNYLSENFQVDIVKKSRYNTVA